MMMIMIMMMLMTVMKKRKVYRMFVAEWEMGSWSWRGVESGVRTAS